MNSLKKLSVFDLDHTLLTVNISFEFGKYLYQKKELSFFQMGRLVLDYALHKLNLFSIEELHQSTFKTFFRGKSKAWIDEEVALFLNQLPSFLFIPACERLESNSYILSSSPDFLVGPIAKKLGIKNWGATSYSVDKEGRLCQISFVMEGLCKAQTLENFASFNGIEKANICFYTDSILDSPVFESVGTCVAVRPDPKLKKLALKKGWEIINDTTPKCSQRDAQSFIL